MIFKHLPYDSLISISLVCKKWSYLAKDEEMKVYCRQQKMVALHILSQC